MLYPKCPSCKTLLANKQIVYEDKMEEICNNDKLTSDAKNMAKRKLLSEIELHRECCRMRMMGYIKLIDKIK